MQARTITFRSFLSVGATIALCLPSLVGGSVFVWNSLFHKQMETWGAVSGATTAVGVFFGLPLVAMAVVVGLVTALSENISARVKAFELITVCCAATATLALLARFSMRPLN